MPSLREVQRAVLRSVLLCDDHDAAAYIAGDALTSDQRLSIYRNTFVSSLTSALRLAFPAVHRLVGAEFFELAAETFLHERPPRSTCLDEYGGEFPQFLARFPPAASLAYIGDVARLEWAVNRALHAPDVGALDVAPLTEIDQADHDRVRFALHPSVSLLKTDHPVDAIWGAVLARDDEALAAIDLAAGPVWLLVQRLTGGVDVERVGEGAWRFAVDLCAGHPLGAALDAAIDLDAAALLADHLNAGRFIAFSVADATPLPPTSEHLR